jgi:hypothetical protein
MTIAIWNHDMTSDRTVITSGGNVTVIGPGAMQEFEGKLGEEVLAEAKRSGVPFSTTPADGVVVGGQIFVMKRDVGDSAFAKASARQTLAGLMVPVGIFDRANLMRLDRDLLLRMAACLGAVLEEEATKKACVEIILAAGVQRPVAGGSPLPQEGTFTGTDGQTISGSANVPPTVTGENQPATSKEKEKEQE